MVDVSQVPGDVPGVSAVKRRNQKSATADVLKGLLQVVHVLTNEHHLDVREQHAAIGELIRRIGGLP